jgi:alkylation response protein AidB-like acyl-CoA dehydrogenase
MIYATSRAVDASIDPKRIRMMVSETKKFVTEACQQVAHNAMQVMGGIGYTNVFPIERIFRDLRLASIWTGTNEVMSMIIANEWYRQYDMNKKNGLSRNHEKDAREADAVDEKVFE